MPSVPTPSSPQPSPAGALATRLCLKCGLCCDGTLFKDVQVNRAGERARLAALGMGRLLRPASSRSQAHNRLPQPCQALHGCACRIYPDRPSRCRNFECLLFKRVLAGAIPEREAGRTIQTALRQRDRVRQLLGQLGDGKERAALSVRFRLMRLRFESGPEQDARRRGWYGDLTLAIQDLNVTLSQSFYPGE